jgi:hypothetical protein
MTMKKILLAAAAAVLALSIVAPAQAVRHKQTASADFQASCKVQAAKKFSAIHFLQRRNFVNKCVAQHSSGKIQTKSMSEPASNKQAAKPMNVAPQPMTAGQAIKPSTTGQAPKQSQ